MERLQADLEAIRTAPDRSRAQSIANQVAMDAWRGNRPASDELAVRDAWYERWGHESFQDETWDTSPRPGTYWTGD